MYIFPFFKSSAQNERVKAIFDELQKKGHIQPDHILEPNINISNFYCRPFLSKKIQYNSTISDLSDDTIRFFLLHEEGHHIKGHFGYLLRLICAVVGIVSIVIGLFLFSFSIFSQTIGICIVCIGILLNFFAFLIFKNFLKNDEYVSDIFAIEKLRDSYHREDPVTIIENGFIELQRHFTNCNKGDHPFDTIENFIFGFTEYHPTHTQRIKNIKNNVDLKNKSTIQ